MFKELFTESTVDDMTIKGLQMLKKSSAVVKNSAVVYGNEIYFEVKTTKQALRLSKSKVQDFIGNGDDQILGFGGGDASGFYDEYKRRILGNPDAKAYVSVRFKTENIPQEYIKAAGARKNNV